MELDTNNSNQVNLPKLKQILNVDLHTLKSSIESRIIHLSDIISQIELYNQSESTLEKDAIIVQIKSLAQYLDKKYILTTIIDSEWIYDNNLKIYKQLDILKQHKNYIDIKIENLANFIKIKESKFINYNQHTYMLLAEQLYLGYEINDIEKDNLNSYLIILIFNTFIQINTH